MIEKLTLSDTKISSELHFEGMPNDYLASFGKKFIQNLHAALITCPYCVCFGYYKNDKLRAVFIGTTSTQKTLEWIFMHSFHRLIPYVLKSILTSYTSIQYLWQTLFYKRNFSNLPEAEILIISVSSDYQHKGIGRKFMHHFQNELKKRNISQFKVSTRKNNEIANKFYKKMGGKFRGSFRIYASTWNTYVSSF